MSELVNLELLDADAIYTANHGIDPHRAVEAWPQYARLDWWSKYHRQMDSNEKARLAA